MSQQDLSQRITQDVAVAAAKISPPAGALLFGLTMNEWAALATIVYVVLQAAYLVWRWIREYRKGKAAKP